MTSELQSACTVSCGDNGNPFGFIKGWDTRKVTDMSSLFINSGFDCHSLTDCVCDISLWGVSNVENMSSMFDNNARRFNGRRRQPLGRL